MAVNKKNTDRHPKLESNAIGWEAILKLRRVPTATAARLRHAR